MTQYRMPGRNQRILDAYLQGKTQQQIGMEEDLSQQRVSYLLARIRESMEPEQVARLRGEMSAICHDLLEMHVRRALTSDLPPAFNGKGEPLRDENDEIVRDAGISFRATTQVLAILERMAKLTGADAPEKHAAEVSVNYTITGADDV